MTVRVPLEAGSHPPVDVLVIGAGSAGAVIAARLSEDGHRSVLLLEDGPDHPTSGTPAALRGPSMMAALAEPGRIFERLTAVHSPSRSPTPYLRGRGVGGSSNVNAMIALRGIPQDYDRWAEELGCTGWSWSDLRPWFMDVEDDADFGDGIHSGKGGPLPLERPPADLWSPWDLALQDAAQDLGYPACPDYHAPGALGFGPAALNVRDGLRVSTNEAYLEGARARRNLRVRGDTRVDRILFDGKRARGVVTVDGEEIAAGHVVLCAGAIHSPAILLRSGLTDLAVGANLCEHPQVAAAMALQGEAVERARGARTVTTVVRYTSGMADAGDADMQLIPLTGLGTEPPFDAMCVLSAAVMRVYSRGRVTLASSDPAVEPSIELNLLSDDRDLLRMRDGVRRVVELIRHPAVGRVAAGPLDGFIPEADLDHPERWDDWIHTTVTNYVHPVGTCRMGRADDPLAVVDLDCTLIGHQGVTVVDASVLPDLPRANTHLTVVAVAERVASRLRSTVLPALRAQGAR